MILRVRVGLCSCPMFINRYWRLQLLNQYRQISPYEALEKLPISENETGVMAQTVIAEKFYQLDHNGDVIPNKVDRGVWSLETAQSGAPYRFVQHELAKPSGSEYTCWNSIRSTTLAASGAVCQIRQRMNRNGTPRHGDSLRATVGIRSSSPFQAGRHSS